MSHAPIPPEKLAEIASLLEKASPVMASRLLAMFERVKVKGAVEIPTEALLQAIRESGLVHEAGPVKRTPGFDRLFWVPFEGLLEDSVNGPLLPGSIERRGLPRCWDILTTEVAVEAFESLDMDVRLAILRGDMVEAEALVGEFRRAARGALEGNPKAVALLARDEQAQPLGSHLLALLQAEEALAKITVPLLSPIGDLTGVAEAELARAMIKLEKVSSEAAAAFALLLMTRLKRPAQVFRVLKNMSSNASDRRLEPTEFAILGHRLIGKAERWLATVEAAAASRDPFDPAAVADAVDRLGSLVTSIEREDILEDGGPWKVRLLAVRKALASRAEAICQRASVLVTQTFPFDRVKVKGAGMMDQPRQGFVIPRERVAMLACLACFLSQTRLTASLAGFAAARDRADRDVRAHVTRTAETLLGMRHHSDAGNTLHGWQTGLLQVVEAFDGRSAAELYARRLAA